MDSHVDAVRGIAFAEQTRRGVRVTPNAVAKTDYPEEAWTSHLRSGNAEDAWDAFLASYRGLIFATIGRLVRDREERTDAFALVCERLREADFRRLRQFEPDGPARFSTWLVTVVRNVVVDWHRQLRGRRRPNTGLDGLGDIEGRIYQLLAHSGLSFVEAYESLKSAGEFHDDFPAFLQVVRRVHREVTREAGPLARELIGIDPAVEVGPHTVQPNDKLLDYERVVAALEQLPPDVRVAVLLFVVDDVPADEVASIVGWPGKKTVYNRVYRALASVRRRLGETG